MMVVNPKTIQSIEPDEQPVDQFSSTGQRVQKPFLFSRMFVQPVEVEPQLIEVQSRSNQGAVEVQRSPTKH